MFWFFPHHNHICLSYVYSVRDGVCKNGYMYIFFLSITFVCHMIAVCEIMYERLVHVFFFLIHVVLGLNACPCEFLYNYVHIFSW